VTVSHLLFDRGVIDQWSIEQTFSCFPAAPLCYHIVYFDGVVFDTSERNGSAIMTTERYLRIRGSEGQSDKEEEREGGSGTEKGPPPPRGL